MSHILIKNATLAETGQVVSVEIKDQFIHQIYTDGNLPACPEVMDATGLLLLPGVIDDHVHFRDPGLTHKADMHSESRAAAAGGVTSYMEMPNTVPQTTTLEALDAKYQHAAETSIVNYSFFLGATSDNASILPTLANRPDVPGVKLFMGSSTGNMLVDDEERLTAIFENTPDNMIIMTHCEDMTIINRNTAQLKARFGDDAPVEYHSIIRSDEASYASTQLAIRMAQKTGARLHVAHIGTKLEAQLFGNEPLSAEKRITAEVCLPHLSFTTEDYAELGTRIKCNPPIHTAADRSCLLDGIRKGWVDVVGTDHAPHLLSEKEGGCLKAVSGMPMVQFSLVAMLQFVKDKVLTYADVVRTMCHNPATLFGVDRRGFILPGYYADLVLVDPKANWTLTTDCIESKCGWSPLEGRQFRHRVVRTLCNGHTVYLNGQVDDTYRGVSLKFNR